MNGCAENFCYLLQCMSPLMALNGHSERHYRCPLSGVKRTLRFGDAASASDPKRTLTAEFETNLGRERQLPYGC